MDSRARRTDDPVSIGRLAAETGLTPDRLRVWERRYGRPKPLRLPSGHRRYPWTEVVQLRRVADLLSRGERARNLLALPPEELDARHAEFCAEAATFPEMETWQALTRGLREPDLANALIDSGESMELVDFLEDRVAPFLVEVGVRWLDGRLDIRHEHFAALAVERVLTMLRRRLAVPAGGRSALLATLPEELHGLGLSMSACVLEELGIRAFVLGVDTPVREIARASTEAKVDLVCVSVSSANGGPKSVEHLRELRAGLPKSTLLVVGGAGVRRGQRAPRGVRAFDDLRFFRAWLMRTFAKRPGGES